jgi:hypothetical protein
MVRVRVRVRVAAREVVAFRIGRNLQCKRSGLPRGMPLVTRMQELQAEEQRRGNQWHPRV